MFHGLRADGEACDPCTAALDKIDEYIQHRLAREAQVVDALQTLTGGTERGHSAAEIAEAIYLK